MDKKKNYVISGYIDKKKKSSILLEDYIRVDEIDNWEKKRFLLKVPVLGFENTFLGIDLVGIIHQDSVELGIDQPFLDISDWGVEVLDIDEIEDIEIEIEVFN